jgi:hypothetical protein
MLAGFGALKRVVLTENIGRDIIGCTVAMLPKG